MKKLNLIASTILLASTLVPPIATADVAGITTGSQLQAAAEKRTQTISTQALKKELDSNPDIVLVDIRMPSEIKKLGGSIDAQQNVNIPRGWLEYRITKHTKSKDTPIVVYCGGGVRTPMVAETLQNMGYTNVKNYSPGFRGWKKAGFPVKK